MNTTVHAVRNGVSRGWTEFVLSLRNPQDIAFYVVIALGALAYLYVNRGVEVEGTGGLMLPTVVLPGLLASLVVFLAVVGPAMALALEREDGTLLRLKAVPHGMTGYVTGGILYQFLGLLPMLVVLLVPAGLLFDGLMHRGGQGWLLLAGYLVLGLLATMPIGIVIGSLASSPNKVTTWGLVPVIVLSLISGIFAPVTAMWTWVQGVAQVFPIYWLGLGMRSAFLPDAAAAIEIGGSWRPVGTVLVLAVWAAVGMVLVPGVLRRMARRESGSAVEARKHERMQRLG